MSSHLWWNQLPHCSHSSYFNPNSTFLILFLHTCYNMNIFPYLSLLSLFLLIFSQQFSFLCLLPLHLCFDLVLLHFFFDAVYTLSMIESLLTYIPEYSHWVFLSLPVHSLVFLLCSHYLFYFCYDYWQCDLVLCYCSHFLSCL